MSRLAGGLEEKRYFCCFVGDAFCFLFGLVWMGRHMERKKVIKKRWIDLYIRNTGKKARHDIWKGWSGHLGWAESYDGLGYVLWFFFFFFFGIKLVCFVVSGVLGSLFLLRR